MRTNFKPFFSEESSARSFDLVALGFVSRSTHELGILGLVNLCVQSYCNNVERGLTGVLFFDGLHFGQVLEGSREVIDERWQVIQRDQRHDDLHVIAYKDIACRSFSNWGMRAPDADAIVMLFPELRGMIHPAPPLYDGTEVSRMMSAYPAPRNEQRVVRYSLPSLH